MLKHSFIFAAFGILVSNAVFSQKSNRVSVQSGIVNSFFDDSPIINKPGPIDFIFDVKGAELMRRIKKSQISIEYMAFHQAYTIKQNYGSSTATAQLKWRDLRFISGFYNRYLLINDHWSFQYGIGASYSWGTALLYHYSFNNGLWNEAYMTGYTQKDINLNVKAGIEYSPIKWLTVYSNFNYSNSIYQENDIDHSQNYSKTYPKNTPNKYLLSLRFGVGFNF